MSKLTSKQPRLTHTLLAAVMISVLNVSAVWADQPVPAASSAAADQGLTREQRHAQHEQERIAHRTAMFNEADTSHDGKLTLQEWLAFKPKRPHDRDGRVDQAPDQAERQRHAEEWFKRVDSNHDGKISLDEAKAGAPRLAKHFDEIDTAHKGYVTPEQLKAFFEAKKAKWEKKRAEWEVKRIQKRTEEFKRADSNHDGVVSLDEWLAFKPERPGFFGHLWHRFGHHHHHGDFGGPEGFGGRDDDRGDGHGDGERHGGFGHRDQGEWFKKVDSNGDGQISQDEAKASAPWIAQHFNEIDTDHNGLISQDELRAYFKAKHDEFHRNPSGS